MPNSKLINYQCKQKSFEILVVEDSVFFSRLLKKALEEDAHKVTQAFSLAEAYKALEIKEFDFILLDLILPDGEGNELLDLLDEKMINRVIVLSGDTDAQRREYLFKAGVLDYFSKENSFYVTIHDIKNLLCSVEQNVFVNILIVDDSSFSRKVLSNLLKPKRYNIYEAINAKEGLKILDQENIHLVLLDYEMPDINGAKMLERIKSNVKFLDLPVIMLSGSQNKDVVANVLKHGGSDFIRKPFANEELLLKCDMLIKNHIDIKRMHKKERELEKSLKALKETQEHKSQFLANMSHEIRTPLNSILGFVDLLCEDESNETKLDYLKTIQKSGAMLLNIVNDVLDFSKIESGKLDIVNEVFITKEFFEHIVSFYKPLMQQAKIDFHYSYDENLPLYFKSDFLRMKQIIINLLGNAIKFTPKKGHILFDMKLENEKRELEISVTDSGIGIAPENHQKVFELFEQAEKTTTKKFGGTGLGLSISAKLATLLHANINLQSELGKGSKFSLSIPLKNIHREEIIEYEFQHNKSIRKEQSSFNKHILLVEDIVANQKYMSIILKKLDLTFDIANDGLEAVEMYKANRYDLVLMDENMPNMSGIEATQEILKYELKNKLPSTPIIALTANAIEGDRERFLEAGFDEYLTKPINKNELAKAIAQLI